MRTLNDDAAALIELGFEDMQSFDIRDMSAFHHAESEMIQELPHGPALVGYSLGASAFITGQLPGAAAVACGALLGDVGHKQKPSGTPPARKQQANSKMHHQRGIPARASNK